MFHCKNLINLPVLDLATDKIIGTLGTIYLNDTLNAVANLSIHSAQMSHTRIIPLSQLVSINSHNIIIRTNEADALLALGVAARTLFRRRVTSERHLPIGHVADVVVDAHGIVAGFWLQTIVMHGALARHPFLKREAILYVGKQTTPMQIDINRSHYFAITLGQQARWARNTII